MLEPITPSHIPQKPSSTKDEKPLGQADNIGDSEGYRFNFFGRMQKKKAKKKSETQNENVYNEQTAVTLSLSPEAEKELEKQRHLKKKAEENQDEE